MVVFPFIIQVQLMSSSFCKFLGWSILIQSFAKLIMDGILADTAILGNASKKEPQCFCYVRTSRACLQLNGMAAEKKRAFSVRKICQLATFLEGQSGL